MAIRCQLLIQESSADLKSLFRKHPVHLHPRIHMLYLIKSEIMDSTNDLSEKLLVSTRSIQHWKKAYAQGGIAQLLIYERGKHKSNGIITPSINELIIEKLSSPSTAFTSYIDLQQWLQENHLPTVSYRVVHHHAHSKLHASLKVARKSHIKKDAVAVEHFKKV
jgi:hypothetical protein